ncbi:glycosyltransferase family 4 protein [Pontimicrobium sp. MEBiC06410]
MKKLVRITTVPLSLNKLLEGQLKFMTLHFSVTAISSNKEELEKVGNKEGVNTYCIELTRKITPFKDLVSVYRLYRYLRSEKPSIVHTHTPKAGIVGMLASYLAKTPNRFHTVAGLPLMEAQGFKKKLLIFIEKLTYKFATRVYPNSFGLESYILDYKLVSQNKLKVIANGSSNGINISYFSPQSINEVQTKNLKENLNLNSKDFIFIFVGRVVKDKGIEELVSAFSQLCKKYKDIKLLLVGSYEKKLDPINLASENTINTNNQIIHVGYKEDVRPFFTIAKVLVFPSYREGFPNVVMQAGAMALPSIVSNINGCNEIIKNNYNGLIVPPKDTNSLLKKMEYFINNPKVVDEMATNCRENIIAKYSHKMIWKKLLEEYKTIE